VAGGGNIIVTASATDTNGGVAAVDFYVSGALLRTVTNAPYSATITNAAIGSYQTFAIARDTFGLSATSAVVSFTAVPPGTNFTDMFVARGFITGYTNFKTATSTSATKEPGEPNHWQFNAGGKSMWISWTAPGTGLVNVDLLGTSFDSVLAVYTNAPGVAASVSNLLKVAENDDNGASLQSKVTFNCTVPGTVFHIAVDGYNSGTAASGNIVMRLSQPNSPPVITTQPVSRTNNVGTNVTFTVVASSPTALSYQWRFNGGNMGNATNAVLTLTNIQLSSGGGYDVRVSNASGSVTSVVATLTVRDTTALPLVIFARMTNSLFTMTFTGGATNRGYIVETSATLTNWSYFTTITTTGAVTIVDSNPPPAGLRAFRARLGP
jgi:hypothetical protein